jgi:hypothetical protein
MTRLFCAAIAVLGIAAVASAQYTSPAVTPLQNAFVWQTDPNNNYGAAGALENAGSGTSNGVFNTYLQFNMSSTATAITTNLGANWTVTSLSLQLNGMTPGANGVFNPSNVSGTFGVEWIDNNGWTQGTGTPAVPSSSGVTWNTQPSAPDDQTAGTFSYNGSTGIATYTLPVISSEVGNIRNGSDMTLEIYAVTSSGSYLFNSNKFTNSADWPMLTVTANVPEPTVVGFLAASPFLLLSRRRKNDA